jgi:hypothetical protein
VAHLDMGFSMGFPMGFPMGLAHWKWCPFRDYGRVQGVGLPEFLPEPIELQWLPVEIRLSELCLWNLYIFTDCIVRQLMFPDMFYHISYSLKNWSSLFHKLHHFTVYCGYSSII